MAEQSIKKLTPEDVLNDLYNHNLRVYIIARSDILYFSSLEPNSPVGQREGAQVGNTRSVIEVKAKDALKQKNEEAENRLKILVSIEQLRKDMKDWKV